MVSWAEKPKRKAKALLPTPGKLHEAAQRKSGWEPLGPYLGRKRPDGIGRSWQ